MSLTDVAYQLEQFGPVAPTTAVEPIRYPQVRTTDGLGIEEGTTNLITNPSFEGGATTGYQPLTGTLTTTTERAFSGTTCLRAAFGTNASIARYIHALTTAGTYTASAWVFVPANVDEVVSLLVFYNGGTSLAASTSVKDQWVRLAVTFTVVAGQGLASDYFDFRLSNSTELDEVIFIDAVQLEAKPYATSYADGSLGTGYSWTGTAHASTSVRAAADLRHPGPTLGTALTCVLYARASNKTATGLVLAVAGGGLPLNIGVGPTAVFLQNGVVTLNRSLTLAPGDLVGLAAVVNGTSYTMYASLNGAPVISSATTSTAFPAVPVPTIHVAQVSGVSHSNAAVEGVTIYNAALTLAEVSALLLGGPRDFADDSRIVYAAATASTRGTLNAITTGGSGRFRTVRQFAASLDANLPPLTAPGSRRLSVPAGTGLGVGDLVRFGDRGYRVSSTYASGGQFDELIVVPFTVPWMP